MSDPIVANLFVPVETLSREAASGLLDRLRAEGCSYPDIAFGHFTVEGKEIWFEHGPLPEMLDLLDEPANIGGFLLSLTRPAEQDDDEEFWCNLSFTRDHEALPHGMGFVGLSMSSVWARHEPHWYGIFRRLVGVLAASTDAIYGGASYESMSEIASVSASSVAALEPQPLEWLNIYGPAYVERIGLERLLSVPPTASAEVLANGGVMVTLGPTPDRWRWRDQQAVAEHLGLPVPG